MEIDFSSVPLIHRPALEARIAHAASTCSFYRHKYRDLKKCETVPFNELPIVSWGELSQQSVEFRSDAPIFRVSASSGTYGKPKILFRTKCDFERSVESQIQLMEWAGVTSDDTILVAQPFGIWGYGDLTAAAMAKLGGVTVPVGMISNESVADFMLICQPTIIDISPTRMQQLLRLVNDVPELKSVPVRIIFLAGESIPGDLPRDIHNIWGADCFDHYGSEETDALGGNVEPGGDIILLDDKFYFEFLDHNGDGVEVGEEGILTISSLYHIGTPLIRYQLGDIVRLVSRSPTKIAVLGRIDESIVIFDSVKIHSLQIEEALLAVFESLPDWQCRLSEYEGKVWLEVILAIEDCSQFEQADLDAAAAGLKRCNIDVEQIVAHEDLEIKLSVQKALFVTERGKKPRVIDDRNNRANTR